VTEWVTEQLALLRTQWPDLTYVEADHWVLLPGWSFPTGWSMQTADIACRIPQAANVPPYAFYVNVAVPTYNGETPDNVAPSDAVPFEGSWSAFSWAPDGPWPAAGGTSNMLHFVRSFNDRLNEGK
jgi:hypothetical protein